MVMDLFDILSVTFTVISTIILAVNIIGLLIIMLIILWNTFVYYRAKCNSRKLLLL